MSHDQSLTEFVAACKTTEPDADGHLALPDDREWFVLGHSKLFVRSFYNNLFEVVLQQLDLKQDRSIPRLWAILGTPGIGKSALGMYLLYRALRQSRPVVYVHGGMEKAYLFQPRGTVYEIDKWQEFVTLSELKNSSTVLLLDSYKAHYCKAFTVMLTSPEPSRTHALKEKLSTTMKLYVPVFSKAEILSMQSSCYPKITEEAAMALYNKWGGSARAIFNTSRGEELMSEAVTTVDLDYLARWMPMMHFSTHVDHKKLPSRLVRIYTRADSAREAIPSSCVDFYAVTKVDFISPNVLWQILERIRLVKENKLAMFIGLAHKSPKLSCIFDKIFERMCISKFQEGVTLHVHPLSEKDAKEAAGKPISVTFPSLKRNDVRGLGGFGVYKPSEPKNAIHVPTSESFPAIDFAVDAALPEDVSEPLFASAVVNATFNACYTISWESRGEHGLKDTLQHWKPSFQKRGSKEACAFIWLVPEATLAKWKSPRRFTANAQLVNSASKGFSALRRVKQYVAYIEGFSQKVVERHLEKGTYPDLDFSSMDPEADPTNELVVEDEVDEDESGEDEGLE